MKKNSTGWLAVLAVVGSAVALWAGSVLGAVNNEVIGSKFTNQGSVANTRHNMTQQPRSGPAINYSMMEPTRNNYGEVCVYCHTPHGANANVALPLWNRTIKATTYTTYAANNSASITQPVTQPGPNSLSCLSCHDGQVAVDSIINMPGTNGYKASQADTAIQDTDFLNAWNNASGNDANIHIGLDPVANNGCLACHSNGRGVPGAGAADFTVFVIGTDLKNDHPVGVRFPTIGPGVDFNPPNGGGTSVRWFDFDGDNRQDINEIRLYDSGNGFAVECASCHDPHGVPSAGPGSTFIPSFLRVNNAFSAVCLTCHIK